MLFAYRGFKESAIFHKQDSTGHGNGFVLGLKTPCSWKYSIRESGVAVTRLWKPNDLYLKIETNNSRMKKLFSEIDFFSWINNAQLMPKS